MWPSEPQEKVFKTGWWVVTYFDDLSVLEVGVLLDHFGSSDSLVTEEGAHGFFRSVLVSLHSLALLIGLTLGVANYSQKRFFLVYNQK